MRTTLAWLPAALVLAAPAVGMGQGAPIRLGLPIACKVGIDCFVQNHFDHDPGPGAKDLRCGSMSYDGHDGVDFRVPTIAAQRRGVAVLAAAAGTVKAVRDGQPDRQLGPDEGRSAVAGVECGNGVLLSHPGGWETQYCHMARGSLAVKPGQAVAAGARLGNVGLSGWTQFPHAHITVRQNGKAVDPFTGGAAACGQPGRSLWATTPAYASPLVINAGFTTGPVAMEAIEAETLARPTRTSPALVGYVRLIGIEAGDVLAVRLLDPAGRELAASTTPMPRARAQQMQFVGERLSGAAWPAGRYRLATRVTRGGRVVLERAAEVIL